VALSILVEGSPFCNALLPVVVACLEEVYFLNEAIYSFCKAMALALLIVSDAPYCITNIVAKELTTLRNL
jgi:hypothetical protein